MHQDKLEGRFNVFSSNQRRMLRVAVGFTSNKYSRITNRCFTDGGQDIRLVVNSNQIQVRKPMTQEEVEGVRKETGSKVFSESWFV